MGPCCQATAATGCRGFGLYWGRVVSQNAKGHILGHVKVCNRASICHCTRHCRHRRGHHVTVLSTVMCPCCALHGIGASPLEPVQLLCLQQASGSGAHVVCRCCMQDIGLDPRRPDTRVYGTSLAQPWHTDASDIVGAQVMCRVYSSWEVPHCSCSPLAWCVVPQPMLLVMFSCTPLVIPVQLKDELVMSWACHRF